MANLKSSKKAIRKTVRRTVRNAAAKTDLMTTVKQVRKLIEANKLEDAKKKIPALQKALDKAVKANMIHTNKASRIKKRIAKGMKPKK